MPTFYCCLCAHSNHVSSTGTPKNSSTIHVTHRVCNVQHHDEYWTSSLVAYFLSPSAPSLCVLYPLQLPIAVVCIPWISANTPQVHCHPHPVPSNVPTYFEAVAFYKPPHTYYRCCTVCTCNEACLTLLATKPLPRKQWKTTFMT